MKIAMIGQKGIARSGRSGGIERHVFEISKRLALIGHTVVVYSRAKYDKEKPDEIEGIQLKYLPTIYTKHLEAIVHTFISTIHAVFGSYDIIHYHGVGPATLAWIPRIFARQTTVIVTFHSQDRFQQKWGLFARTYLRFGEWASVIFSHYCICVSHEMQVYCEKTYNKETVYIPNGAEVKEVQGQSQLRKFGLQSKKYFLNVGRLVPQKGIHHLIKAFKSLNTDYQMVLVGAPSFTIDYYKQLREMASSDDRVHFLGFQEGETLSELYANAYAYVHPSEYEGLPLVVLEAMSYGLMPIVSDIPANIEAIHGIGLSFANKDVDDLGQKLAFALSHESLVIDQADQAKNIIEQFFNWDIITDHIESVYITARH